MVWVDANRNLAHWLGHVMPLLLLDVMLDQANATHPSSLSLLRPVPRPLSSVLFSSVPRGPHSRRGGTPWTSGVVPFLFPRGGFGGRGTSLPLGLLLVPAGCFAVVPGTLLPSSIVFWLGACCFGFSACFFCCPLLAPVGFLLALAPLCLCCPPALAANLTESVPKVQGEDEQPVSLTVLCPIRGRLMRLQTRFWILDQSSSNLTSSCSSSSSSDALVVGHLLLY